MLEVPVHKQWKKHSVVKHGITVRLLVRIFLLWVLQLSSAWAGGGPETTLVVVNAASPISLTIANAYVRMRDIPESHVVYLDDVPTADSISMDSFRSKILQPILDYIAAHHLDDAIDTITYSADFPYRVDFSADLKAKHFPHNRHLGHYASLTGLTFFANRVASGGINFLGENRYFRRDLAPQVVPPRPPTAEERRHIDKAIRVIKRGDYAEAVDSLQAVVKDYPWSAKAWYQLARSYAALDRKPEAMAALTKAVKMGWPNSLSARHDKLLKPLHDLPGFAELIHRMQLKTGPFQPAHGFRHQYTWNERHDPVSAAADAEDRYYLSTLLAYTGLHGNSVPEVLNYLRTAVASDASNPDGTVYLMENSNIRSRAREGSFYATAAALKRRGRRVEILAQGQNGQDGILPRHKQDVIGAVVGARRYDWRRSRSRMLPGAIAESLTSYGGDFDNNAQTKLTEFLRYGAAGSSGAVAEPYSIQAKFPMPALHIYYADGSSLAEAFYQSVEAPYQLIVVGAPLARPFAHFADVKLASPATRHPWHDAVLLKPKITAAKGHSVHHVELWLDGRYIDQVAPWDVFVWDTRTVEDGCHDLRLVAVEDSRIETRSYVNVPIVVNNHDHTIKVDAVDKPVTLGDAVTLSGTAPGARSAEVYQGTRLLGTARVEDGRWTATIASRALGVGKVPLYARAFFGDGATARSRAALLEVRPPPRLVADGKLGGDYRAGLAVHGYSTDPLVVKKLDGRLKGLDDDHDATLRFAGEFKVAKPGFYQLSLAGKGRLRVKVDGRLQAEQALVDKEAGLFIPLNLGGGWHRLDMELTSKGQPFVRARLGGEQVTETLAGKRLRHSIAP